MCIHCMSCENFRNTVCFMPCISASGEPVESLSIQVYEACQSAANTVTVSPCCGVFKHIDIKD